MTEITPEDWQRSAPELEREADDLVEYISRQFLARRHPLVQGLTVAKLVAVFVAGHHPSLREKMFEMTIATARQFIPIAEAEQFPNGKPEGWETQ